MTHIYFMNFIKKLFFILSLTAEQLWVKIDAQPGAYFTTASTTSSNVPGCGGMYTSLSGTISSPNYPSNYTNNLNCSYYIQISPANSVNITFISFDTEQGYDYLQVSCLSDSSKAVPKFYGSNLPPFLSINPCYIVQLLFYSDDLLVGQGFSLRYDIGNGLQGGLTMKPLNAYVRYNSTEPIVLSCSSRANLPDAYPWWAYSTDGYSYTVITSPNCSVLSSPNTSNLISYISTARHDSIKTCNLAISPSYINSTAGIYSCTDATLDYAVALVTNIGPSFTGMYFNSRDTGVVPDYQISLICSVQFFQTAFVYLQLTPSVSIHSDDSHRPITVLNTTASITVSALPDFLPSYVCNINFTFSSSSLPSKCATNLPQNISLMTPSRQVSYPEKDNSSLIVGVVLGIAVLLLLIVAIVQCVLLCRMKHSATSAKANDANYDEIHSITRTDADPLKPHVYPLAQSETLNVNQERSVATSGRKDVASNHVYDSVADQIYNTEIHAADKRSIHSAL